MSAGNGLSKGPSICTQNCLVGTLFLSIIGINMPLMMFWLHHWGPLRFPRIIRAMRNIFFSTGISITGIWLLDQLSNHNGSINRSIDGMTSLLKGFGILILYDEKVNYGLAELLDDNHKNINNHPKYKSNMYNMYYLKTKMIF